MTNFMAGGVWFEQCDDPTPHAQHKVDTANTWCRGIEPRRYPTCPECGVEYLMRDEKWFSCPAGHHWVGGQL